MRHLALGSTVVLLVVGCAYGEIRQVLRAEFANELACPEVRIEKKGFVYVEENPDAERYFLKGCGVERTYSCPPDRGLVPYDESGCTWVEGDPERQQLAADTAGGEAAEGEAAGESDAFEEDAPDAPDAPEDGSDEPSDSGE